jgi:hypothetical protein
MANQVTVQFINVIAPKIVKLSAPAVENFTTRDYGDEDALAVEYIAVHDRSPGLGCGKGCAC